PWQAAQWSLYSAAPCACASLSILSAASACGGVCGRLLRNSAIAAMSESCRYCVLRNTTSAIGPSAAPRGVKPVLSSATTSAFDQSATPASALDASDGAYQFCSGISPPLSSRLSRVAPNALRGEWQGARGGRGPTRKG